MPIIWERLGLLCICFLYVSAELQKVLDLPPNLDFKVQHSSFQSFVKIRKKSLYISRRVLIDLSLIYQNHYMCLENIACSPDRNAK